MMNIKNISKPIYSSSFINDILSISKKYILKSFIVIMSFAFISCEKEAVNVKMPKVDPKLVVQSYISPQDTLLVVHVTESNPVFGRKYYGQNSHSYVKDALVTLSDGTNSIILEYASLIVDYGYYRFDSAYIADADQFPIIAGKTYTLNVVAPDGKKAESTCIVPLPAPSIFEFKLDSTVKNDNGWIYKEYNISFSFNDIPGQTNYYKLGGDYYNIFYDYYLEEEYSTLNPIFFENEYMNDQGKDGDKIKVNTSLPFRTDANSGISRPFEMRVYVINTDSHYYKYHQSVRNSYNDNPFAEPVIIYNNINGGLGVFSAYNKTVFDYTLD